MNGAWRIKASPISVILEKRKSHCMNPTNRPKWVHTPPKGLKSFDISCGMCDTECVSGQATGPRIDGNECPGVWSWKLDQCRRMDRPKKQWRPKSGIAAAAADGARKGVQRTRHIDKINSLMIQIRRKNEERTTTTHLFLVVFCSYQFRVKVSPIINPI